VIGRRDTQSALAASTAGERDYVELIEPHRDELRAHCYRLLGSVEDAEDAVQETLVRAWRALPRFEGRGSLRGWLYRIATNAAVDAARARGRTVPIAAEEADLRERVDGDHEQREALRGTLAMVRELLPRRQATVLVARTGLGFSARDTADLLGMSEAAVNSAVQRARTGLRRRRRALA